MASDFMYRRYLNQEQAFSKLRHRPSFSKPLICCLSLMFFVLTCQMGWAQQDTTPENTRLFEERKPSAYYLPVNGSDEYKRVASILYEEFEKWYLDRLNPPKNLPAFYLAGIKATAKPSGTALISSVQLEVKPQQLGWLKIPLGFQDAVLKQPPKTTPELNQRLVYEEDAGYFIWLEIQEEDQLDQVITLSYRVLVPVKAEADLFESQLNFPEAISCELSFQAQGEKPWLKVATQAVVEPWESEDQLHTQLIRFAGGSLILDWGFERTTNQEVKPEYRVSGSSIFATITDETQINCEANLRIECINGALDFFDLRIAEDSIYVPESEANSKYTIQEITSIGAQDRVQKLLRVELLDKTQNVLDFQLRTIQRKGKTTPNSLFEVGMFDVLGSKIQDGTLYLKYQDNVTVSWDNPSLSQIEPSVEYYDQVEAAFQFNSQPSGLKIRVKPSRAALSVKPRYQLFLTETEAQLSATFDFTTPTNFNGELRFKISDWEIDSIEFDDPNQRWSQVLEGDQLVLQLIDQNPFDPVSSNKNNNLLFTILSHKSYQGINFSRPLEVSLPWIVPLVSQIEPAFVNVNNAPSIQVQPVSAKMPAFRLDRLSAGSAESNTSVYRFSSVTNNTNFVCEIIKEMTQVIVNPMAKAKVIEATSQVSIEQSFQVNSLYQKPQQILLELPKKFDFPVTMQVMVNRQNATFVTLRDESESNLTTQQIQIELPAETQEDLLEIQYFWPLTNAESMAENRPSLIVPLFQSKLSKEIPGKLDRGPFRLELETTGKLQLKKSMLNLLQMDDLSDSTTSYLIADSITSFELEPTVISTVGQSQIKVVHAWIQSTFLQESRRDRVNFLILTERDQVTLDLPSELTKLVELRWNQKTIPINQLRLSKNETQQQIVIPNQDKQNSLHNIELWYDVDCETDLWQSMDYQLPRLRDSIQLNKSYLQIIAPEHWVCLSVLNWQKEMDWVWNRFQLQTVNHLTQADLEKLLQTSVQDLPTPGLQENLYSSIQNSNPTKIYFVRKSVLFLVASGTVLTLGLLLIYLPMVRKVWVLWSLTVCFLIAAVVFPQLTIFLGQLASLGIILFLLAIVLSVVLQWMKPRRPTLRGVTPDSQLAAQFYQEGEQVSNHSTATVPGNPPGSSIAQPEV